jgi:hypothetical protein
MYRSRISFYDLSLMRNNAAPRHYLKRHLLKRSKYRIQKEVYINATLTFLVLIKFDTLTELMFSICTEGNLVHDLFCRKIIYYVKY